MDRRVELALGLTKYIESTSPSHFAWCILTTVITSYHSVVILLILRFCTNFLLPSIDFDVSITISTVKVKLFKQGESISRWRKTINSVNGWIIGFLINHYLIFLELSFWPLHPIIWSTILYF